MPVQLHSDCKTQFKAALFTELCVILGVDKTLTTLYKPQVNGKCERFNRTLVAMMRRAVQRRSYNWEMLLSQGL